MCRTAAAGGVEVAAHTHERACSYCYAALCMHERRNMGRKMVHAAYFSSCLAPIFDGGLPMPPPRDELCHYILLLL